MLLDNYRMVVFRDGDRHDRNPVDERMGLQFTPFETALAIWTDSVLSSASHFRNQR